MIRFPDGGFTKFETMLGVSLVLIAGLATVPLFQQHQGLAAPVQALLGAEEIAHAVVDYRTDTGAWPLAADGQVDLSRLTTSRPVDDQRTRQVASAGMTQAHLLGAMADVAAETHETSAAAGYVLPAWLDEVPLDPWQRPYRVIIMGETPSAETAVSGAGLGGYPDTPPPGVAVVVISAGENGRWETDWVQMWDADLARRMGRDSHRDTPLRGDVFGGDDLGFVLSRLDIGD